MTTCHPQYAIKLSELKKMIDQNQLVTSSMHKTNHRNKFKFTPKAMKQIQKEYVICYVCDGRQNYITEPIFHIGIKIQGRTISAYFHFIIASGFCLPLNTSTYQI
jgi:hypothetical protein